MSSQKSILMTPDPYHTPGYGGYCPQFKYQIGETFGRTTSRLLRDRPVPCSRRLVLADIKPSSTKEEGPNDPRVEALKTRKQSWGDQKLVETMVPGYTGFIPKSQHYFGKRYAQNCLSAVSQFEDVQKRHRARRSELIPDKQQETPKLKAKGTNGGVYLSKNTALYKNTAHHSMSPYYMSNENKYKMFMSGYTGFVPRARNLIGSGYPIITHNALNEFTDDVKRLKDLEGSPIQVDSRPYPRAAGKPIYPVESGLVPHYTGHIPGEKFRYGQTFGHSTQNALKDKPVTVPGLKATA